MRTVILGMGAAGLAAARYLRAADPAREIVLVSAESPHPLARTAWMYVLARQLRECDAEPVDRAVLDGLRIARVHARAVRVDLDARSLVLADGTLLPWDQLLLATGSRVRPLDGVDPALAGVHAFVTLDDLRALDAGATSGARAVVVGGGLTGVEVAEALVARGVAVTWVVREDRASAVLLHPREAALVHAQARARGIDVRVGVAVRGVRTQAGRVAGVTLAQAAVPRAAPGTRRAAEGGSEGPSAASPERPDGAEGAGAPLGCDLLVNATGVVPQLDFDTGALERGPRGGLRVDTRQRVSVAGKPVEGIVAAGDCAELPHGEGTRVETRWDTAQAQGIAAARTLLGEDAPYLPGVWTTGAKFLDLVYTGVGWLPEAWPGDGRPLRTWWQAEAPDASGRVASVRVVEREGRVVGVSALGRTWEVAALARVIAARVPLSEALSRLPDCVWEGSPWRPREGAVIADEAEPCR